MRGYIHLYYGEGKGKTTAAMGLASRALGHGKKVVIVQFLKKGESGEVNSLEKLGAHIFSGKAGDGFRVADMTGDEREKTKEISNENLKAALECECDVLILDELCAALNNDMADMGLIKKILQKKDHGTEIIITGRKPPQW
ncbi:MAG: cob(I)yrinic acid a,c-diamide adenosyltransferase, partial [Lachnospiraceae bacterium]|nr:cob(I)yrinic acid a,c-diamide adenosyltransferase [Lachnospiraceae bacterium]